MNILITGSNGFLGRNLSAKLSYKYNITAINRKHCNLLDYESVKKFFTDEHKTYDLVLHTAIEGGRRNQIDSPDLVYTNLVILYNLLSHQNYFHNIISFGSGAELDRRLDINQDSSIFDRYPIDPYGLSKNIINKLCHYENKLCNFRIFNCFGIDEQPDRMIRGNIIKYLNKLDMVIHQNKQMDFFYIDDLVSAITFFIEQRSIPKHFECCYKEKYSLSDIAHMINNLDKHKVKIIIQDNSTIGKDYCGSFQKIPIEYIGLQKALKIIYNSYHAIQ